MEGLETQIYSIVGHEFNIGSNKQLAHVLYEELGLEPPKETDSGQASTAKDALAELKNDHEVIPLLLDHSKYATLVSLVTSNWPDHISPHTGRMHGSFKITSTNTRRLSAGDPNLQNVPRRSEEGGEIRKCIIAPEGRSLVVQDMSQIEYRLLAHVCGSKVMRKMFRDGHDFHAAMAADVLGGNWKDYKDQKRHPELYAHRDSFKTVNFGIIYEIGYRSLARQIGKPEKYAYRLLADYNERFPEIGEWKNNVKAYARKSGYVETLFGSRIHVPFIRLSDKAMQSYGERQAVNAVIQGTAADMMRLAMAKVHRRLKKFNQAYLLLSVHDELVAECRDEDAEEVRLMMKETIETCADKYIDWSIPIVSEGDHGKSWGEAK